MPVGYTVSYTASKFPSRTLFHSFEDQTGEMSESGKKLNASELGNHDWEDCVVED